MSHSHNHGTTSYQKETYLWVAFSLTFTFLIAEVIGGITTGSLALLSDAAHMLTDVSALIISLIAIRIAKKSADLRRTFGYYRFEILAATFNTVLLFFIAIYILYEAAQRYKNPVAIHSIGMLAIALVGLAVNLISMRLLSTGKESSLNVKSAYLEVWSDMISSVGVIAGAVIIRFTQWWWVDSVISVAIGCWVLPRTWVLLKDALNILLEGVPEHINLNQLKQTMCGITGILDIHDLHVWAITSGKTCLTAHVLIEQSHHYENVLLELRTLLASQFAINHTTLEPELIQCANADNKCGLF